LRDGFAALQKYLLDNLGELIDILCTDTSNSDAVSIYMRAMEVFKLEELADRIANTIFTNKALAQRFTTFFQRPPPIANSIFNTMLQLLLLIAQRDPARMAEYLKATKASAVVQMLQHIQQPSVIPFLMRLIENDPLGRSSQALADGNVAGALLERLARASSLECGADEICVCEALTALVNVDLFEGRPLATAPLVRQMCESANVRHLYNFALKTGRDAASRAEAAFVPINAMLRRCVASSPTAEQASSSDLPAPVRASLNAIAPVVKTLRAYKTERYFGCHRLAMTEFVCALAASGYRHAHTALIDAGAIAVVLDIFFDRVWLNFVHRLVAELVESAMMRGKASEPLLLYMVTDLALPKRCNDAAAANQVCVVRASVMLTCIVRDTR
jgi:hypothetical protein